MEHKRMEEEWDERARVDAVRYIADGFEGEGFYESGIPLAHSLCDGFFREIDFDPEGKRVLDIGCGIGRLETGFSEMFGEVVGLDVSGEMIARAKEQAPDLSNVTFVKGNGHDLAEFPDGHFDFVFSYLTFQHIPEKAIILDYLREIRRVLKEDGLFMILFRRDWSGFAKAFGFFPIPRRLYPLIPDFVWRLYQRMAGSEEERLCRGATYRGSGISRKEMMRIMERFGFSGVRLWNSESEHSYWCGGRKPVSPEDSGAE